ncbi:MAG: homoserine kinase [SAR202 cluster bacterium Io17-Chloro-G9]|nr:MAG: homoserine kinase [SAR202 cluster bacterium Io17-Chloro-G9]
MSKKQISVLAPATTANLGPGFDCLGMALDIWNRLDVFLDDAGQVSVTDNTPLIEVVGEGSGELSTGRDNLVHQAMEFLFHEAGGKMPAVRLTCHNEIPLMRGLGSSAAAIAGGLLAANALCSGAFSSKELLEMAVTIEGHPDNVAAAVLGGLQLVVSEGNHLLTAPINVPPEIHGVLFVPALRIATSDAREVLPQTVSRSDAIYNMSRASLLVAGMAANHPEYFREATQDRLHQPYRQPLFPAMKLLFQAALDAGALGVFLSGSGSTVLALTNGREMTVAYEMAEAAKQAGVEGQVKITQPSLQGAHVIEGPATDT